MIGLVLVTHGRLAEEFVAALEHVVGPQANMRGRLHRPRRRHGAAAHRTFWKPSAQADEGDGVILLTDMFGGTPSNLAISIMDKANVEVIAGVNLPMLIKLASVRTDRAAGGSGRRAPRRRAASTSTSPPSC